MRPTTMKRSSIVSLVFIIGIIVTFHHALPQVTGTTNSRTKAQIKHKNILIIPKIEFSAGNHSDSILKSHGMLYNGTRSIYIGRIKKCGITTNFFYGGIAQRNLELPNQFKFSWFHKLSGNTYSATMPLNPRTVDWAFNVYIPQKSKIVKTAYVPAINIFYRTRNRVEAWLVLFGDTKEKTAIKLGEAISIVTSHSNRKFSTYLDLQGNIKANIFQGYIHKYDREFDHNISKEKRFGCQRDANDILMIEKMPVRHSLLVGLRGEYIPCKSWSCEDKRYLINLWQDLKDSGKLKTGSYSQRNPSPLRVHPKFSKTEYKTWLNLQIERRKDYLKSKEKIWICLVNGKPCFKGILKDYGYKSKAKGKIDKQHKAERK